MLGMPVMAVTVGRPWTGAWVSRVSGMCNVLVGKVTARRELYSRARSTCHGGGNEIANQQSGERCDIRKTGETRGGSWRGSGLKWSQLGRA